MSLYDKALKIAMLAHNNQVDKAGIDYIQHPIYVASLVNSEYEKATALLHDVVEDSNIQLSDLREYGIPDEVIMAVSALTKNNTISNQDYLKNVKKNELARTVKLADLKHNSDISRIKTPSQVDYERILKYQKAIEYLK